MLKNKQGEEMKTLNFQEEIASPDSVGTPSNFASEKEITTPRGQQQSIVKYF